MLYVEHVDLESFSKFSQPEVLQILVKNVLLSELLFTGCCFYPLSFFYQVANILLRERIRTLETV